ncbi:P-loop containing nucleoside triphosphate hydrolase protein [Pelagophyceae sp. CCMP2097]|nr:P-loop containing nucleoside triphosphate hydrolase protein [Pelagophyceae sp. CCMP2097]
MRMASFLPPLVVAGCSGAGKGTLISKLMDWDRASFGFSVSHTTRAPRAGEVDGVHYHFATVENMKRDIDAGLFIESANVHGNYYGTSKAAVEDVQQNGRVCILDIDVQGVQNVKRSTLCPKYLWVEAPSMDLLEKRLRGRGTETEETLEKRLKNAGSEMDFAHPADGSKPFDAYVVNDDVDRAFEQVCVQLYEWYPHLKPNDNAVDAQQTCISKIAALVGLK